MTETPNHIQDDAALPLSIVIETANTPPGDYHELDATLQAFDRQTLASEQFEIIVVADPLLHPDLHTHLARSAPRARLVEAPGLHYYAQKNRGAREARGQIIGFMDSDCIPVESWAAAMLEVFEENDDRLGAAQGTVYSDRSALGFAFVITNFGLLQSRRKRRTTMLTGNNCAFRRDEFFASPFAENPTFHGSDVRMSAHIREQGKFILLVPGAANHHHFLPGFTLFLAHGIYWGYCFLKLRRAAAASVPYGKLFRRLGWFAPLALLPAKAALDLWRMGQRHADLQMSFAETLGCAAALMVNAFAVGWGAARAAFGMPPPTAPTSSNAHLSALPEGNQSARLA